MINTYSKFYYGCFIDSDTKYLDFNEGTGQISAVLRAGHYTLDTICDEIKYQMETIGTQEYTVTANRTTRKITISASTAFEILGSTGTNVANGCYSQIGYNSNDTGSATSHAGSNSIGSVYYPQYKLQDYVSSDDNQMLRDESVMKSASGLVEVISFGTDKMFEFNIKFATNIHQPITGPIVSNLTGVSDLRTFMQYLINKYEVEFMPDKDNPDDFYRVVLESASGNSKGTGYKLEEQYGRGLVGYFETGILKFRVIEG